MKKRAVTLLEVMIVIVLIGLIGGVLSYNLKGSLDKGRAFRSKEGAKKLADILNLELQTNGRIEAENLLPSDLNQKKNLELCLKHSGLVSNSKESLKDGWGEPYLIKKGRGNIVKVESQRLKTYNKEHNLAEDDGLETE